MLICFSDGLVSLSDQHFQRRDIIRNREFRQKATSLERYIYWYIYWYIVYFTNVPCWRMRYILYYLSCRNKNTCQEWMNWVCTRRATIKINSLIFFGQMDSKLIAVQKSSVAPLLVSFTPSLASHHPSPLLTLYFTQLLSHPCASHINPHSAFHLSSEAIMH